VNHPLFDLTIDLGHVHCSGEGDIGGLLRRWRTRIANIHIEDMQRGVHEHLMFGQGTMEFPPIFQALHEIGYEGGVHVELSRHSHMAVEAVQASAAFLKPLIDRTESVMGETCRGLEKGGETASRSPEYPTRVIRQP